MPHAEPCRPRSLVFEALAAAVGEVVEPPHSFLDGMLLDGGLGDRARGGEPHAPHRGRRD